MSEALGEFDKKMRLLAQIFYKWITTNMQGKKWSSAFLEVRYAKEGSYWNDRMRVQVPDGKTVSLDGEDQIRVILLELNELRLGFGWFGMILTVDPSQKVTIKYDSNPDCVDDPTFFDE